MTAREGELKPIESFEKFIDEATVGVYLDEEDRDVLEGNLLSLWNMLNTRPADPRIAELEAENAKLKEGIANKTITCHEDLVHFTARQILEDRIEKLEGLLRRVLIDQANYLGRHLYDNIAAALGGGRETK